MMPGIGVVRGVPNHRNLEEQIERQMGCMAGFIQLFDRQQILTGKRFYSAKRLPSSMVAGSASPSEKSEISTFSVFKEVPEYLFSPSPDGSASSQENDLPTNFPARHTLPLPVFEGKDGVKSSWKLREAPRLSLDSRANVDAKGKLRPRQIQTTPMAFTSNLSEASEGGDTQEKQQRRSPSVVARLMGLEELPIEESPKKPELRRSASESRVYRDLSPFDSQNPFPIPSEEGFRLQKQDYKSMKSPNTKPDQPPRLTPGLFQRSFETQEFFPDPKRLGSLYGELEKRLRMRGIQEPARDLETLKQILEALQLKGLLHSKQTEHHETARLNNFHDRRPQSSPSIQPPIVVMKPVPKTPSRSIPPRGLPMQEPIPPARIRRDRLELDRNFRSNGHQSPTMAEPSLPPRNPSDPPKRRRPLKDEGQSSPLPQRRVQPAQSPKSSPKRLGSGQSGPPKTRRQTTQIPPNDVYSTAEDDTSTVSEFEFERSINEDYRSGRSLLERCDKLLHSIAAITSSAEQVIPTDRQLSPVSVLDSSLHSDESSTSSLPKRAIGFNDKLTEWHGEHWDHHPKSSTTGSNYFSGPPDHHPDDYAFVLDVLHESDLHHINGDDDAFAAIETRHRSATSSTLHRRLIFDTVTELVNRKRHFSPWLIFSGDVAATTATTATALIRDVWEEICQIQERIPAATSDAMEATCSVIKKDMAAGSDREKGWSGSPEEMSEAVLNIERQVFKDLVADTIRELADLTGRCRRTVALSRRKLVF